MSNDTVQRIEENIRQSREIVDLNTSLVRLMSNRDFLKVIKEGYFEKEAIRLVHLRGDPAFQTPERQADVLKQIDGISQFGQYLRTVQFNAEIARKAIETDEAVRDEILAEEQGK